MPSLSLKCRLSLISPSSLLPPSHNSRGFSDEERALAVLRMTEDAGEPDSTEGEAAGMLHGLKLAATDYKVYVLSMALTCMVIGLSFNQFFPQL